MSAERPENTRLLGLVTIGQAPRDDVLPQILPFLPPDLPIRQAGALDDLTPEQIARLAPRPGEYILHTRLRDGTSVTVARERLLPLLQAQLDRLAAEGANPIILLCTGEFPTLTCPVVLIEPDRLVLGVVSGLRPQRLGVLLPLPNQIDEVREKWAAVGSELTFAAASPYADLSAVAAAAEELGRYPPDLIVMDCIGYTPAHKRLVVEATGRPVILSSAIVGRIAGELLS